MRIGEKISSNPSAQPRLTIIVAIKNAEDYIERIKPWMRLVVQYRTEVIFVNDQSSDQTALVITRMIEDLNSDSIFLLNGDRGGPGSARNIGLRFAHGTWIAFWDADDTPNVENFMTMIEEAEKSEMLIAVGSWKLINSQNPSSASEKIFMPKLASILRNPGLWRWAFKSEVINDAEFPRTMMGEDQVFLANLNISFHGVYKFQLPVYNYFTNDSKQLTRSPSAVSSRVFMYRYLDPISRSISEGSLFGFLLQLKIRTLSVVNRIRHV